MRFLLAAVVIGGSFGSASAETISLDGPNVLVEIEVEVTVSAQAVVAHLSFDQDVEFTLPLLDRGDGVFGIRTELEAKNYQVVFEVVGAENPTSDPVSLLELGAVLEEEDPGATATTVDDGLSTDSRQMLWLAIAAGAASLSLLAFWVLGGDDRRKRGAESASGESEEE